MAARSFGAAQQLFQHLQFQRAVGLQLRLAEGEAQCAFDRSPNRRWRGTPMTIVPAMRSPARMRSRLKNTSRHETGEPRAEKQIFPLSRRARRRGRDQNPEWNEDLDLAREVAGNHRRGQQRSTASVDHADADYALAGVAPCQESSKWMK